MRNTLLLALAAVMLAAMAACGGTSAPAVQPSASASIPDFRTTPEPSTGLTVGEQSYFYFLRRDSLSFIAVLRKADALLKGTDPLSDRQIERLRTQSRKLTRLYSEWRRRPAPSRRFRHLRELWLASLSQFGKGGLRSAEWLATGDERDRVLGSAMLTKGARSAKACAKEIQRILDRFGGSSQP